MYLGRCRCVRAHSCVCIWGCLICDRILISVVSSRKFSDFNFSDVVAFCSRPGDCDSDAREACGRRLDHRACEPVGSETQHHPSIASERRCHRSRRQPFKRKRERYACCLQQSTALLKIRVLVPTLLTCARLVIMTLTHSPCPSTIV